MGDDTVVPVFHLDSDFAWRKIVLQIIESLPGFSYLGCASSGARALAALAATAMVDLILVDVSLHHEDAFAVMDALQHLPTHPQVLVLTGRSDEYTLVKTEKAGIAGLVWKAPDVDTKLPEALLALRDGRRHFPPEYLTERERLHRSPIAFFKILSPTEQALLPSFGLGRSDDAIAIETGLRPSTVKWHRHRILARLDLHHTSDLMLWVREKGFLPVTLATAPCALIEQ